MTTAVYPGSFDPITCGHLDIIRRASRQFDRVIIAVLNNTAKKPMFTAQQRVRLIEKSIADLANCSAEYFDGLLVDFARERNARTVIKGLRAISDFEYEMQMASFNRHLNPDIETVFFTADGEFSLVSSSMIRNIASLHGDIKSFVPAPVYEALLKKC